MVGPSARSNRFSRSPRLSRAERFDAAWAGFRDGRSSWPPLPQQIADGPLTPAEPSYRTKLRYLVLEAASRSRSQLFENSRLPVEIFLAAGAVVAHEATGTFTRAHADRFQAALMTWAAQVQVQGARVEATVARANQRLAHYRESVLRHHVQLRRATQPPDLSGWCSPIQLEPAWHHPLELLKHWALRHGDPDNQQYGVLVRALEIVNG